MQAPTTGLYGQTVGLPARHQVVKEKRVKISKKNIEWERSHRKYAYMIAPADADETWFRHHFWEARRSLVRNALTSVLTSDFAMNRFDECGSEALIEYSKTEDRYRIRANYCHCRFCAPCAKAKAGTLSRNLRARLEKQPQGNDRYRFITLTLAHHAGDGLRDLIMKLLRCFALLRTSKVWKNSQRGGCMIMEVKWSRETGWHPHLHIAAEGDWMRQETLSKEWHRVTGDSFKVDIRALKDAKDTAFYVSKYVTKGVNDEVWLDHNAAAEFVTSMKGVRTCGTFGNWRGFKLLAQDREHEATDWQPVSLLSQLAARARSGEIAAITMLMALEDAFQYNPHKKRHTRKSTDPPT